MLLGIGLHAWLALFPTFWMVQNESFSLAGPYDEFFWAVTRIRYAGLLPVRTGAFVA